MKAIFQRFEENKSVHLDLGPPSRIFALAFLMEIGQWPQPQSQNRRSKLKTGFVVHRKAPIRERPRRHIHFLKNVECKSSKNENNPKNSVNCEHFIFGLGHIGLDLFGDRTTLRCFSMLQDSPVDAGTNVSFEV